MASTTGVGAGGGQVVRMLSLNVGGINAAVKRTKIFTHIQNLKADVMFLQETHLLNTDHQRLTRPWIGQIFHSRFNQKTRGTAILIRKNVLFAPRDVIADPNGRYTIVSGTLYQKPVILASVYAPNWDDHTFMKNFLSSLPNINSHMLIMGGDMNCVIDPMLDRSSHKNVAPSRMARTLSSFMEQNGYIDPWRFLNHSTKQYSFLSYVHRTYSRIDYFLIDKTLTPYIVSAEYSPIAVSDHSSVILDIRFELKHKFQIMAPRPPIAL